MSPSLQKTLAAVCDCGGATVEDVIAITGFPKRSAATYLAILAGAGFLRRAGVRRYPNRSDKPRARKYQSGRPLTEFRIISKK